jgi:hypothetical protein
VGFVCDHKRRCQIDDVSGVGCVWYCVLCCSRSMMEGLIRDLQAKEYLYWQMTGTQVRCSVVWLPNALPNTVWCRLCLVLCSSIMEALIGDLHVKGCFH